MRLRRGLAIAEGQALGEVPSEAHYSIVLDDMDGLQIGLSSWRRDRE